MRSLEDLLGSKVWEGEEEAATLSPEPPELKGWPAGEAGRVGVRVAGV